MAASCSRNSNEQGPRPRKRGRSLAWSRIPAWGAGDPGFKSQRPHHDNTGPYGDVAHYLRLLKILASLNSQTYSNPASISFLASCTVVAVAEGNSSF